VLIFFFVGKVKACLNWRENENWVEANVVVNFGDWFSSTLLGIWFVCKKN